ncbi:MAG TPA: hypothetical protein VNW95_03980 [Mucilaginibacter sp.]|jgi:hypothetical protein|nr:hypothetical protein [Mucilaginibacter sp.]
MELTTLLISASGGMDHGESSSLYLAIFGAFSAIMLSIIGAWLTNHSKIDSEKRKLRESHYAAYIEALQNSRDINNRKTKARWDEVFKDLAYARNRLFTIASMDVITKLLLYEQEWPKGGNQTKAFTELIKAIRRDLNLPYKSFPEVDFVGAILYPGDPPQ